MSTANSHGKFGKPPAGGSTRRPLTPSTDGSDSDGESEYIETDSDESAQGISASRKNAQAKSSVARKPQVVSSPQDPRPEAMQVQKEIASESSSGEDTPSETDTDERSSDVGENTPSESEDDSARKRKTEDGRAKAAAAKAEAQAEENRSAAKRREDARKPVTESKAREARPTRPAEAVRRDATRRQDHGPSRSNRDASTTGSSRVATERDPELGGSDGWKEEDAGCCGCGNCGGCCGLGGCWGEIVEWRIWSWLRRRSAYIVAGTMAGGMVAVGGTGLIGQWTFVSVGGNDLGGLGYCQAGQCTFGIAYDLDLPSTSLILSTRVFSVLSLVLALIGALTLALLFYLVVAAQCSSGSFRPPHRVFLRCFFSATPNRTDSETAIVERKAQFENGLSKTKWAEKGREGRERMKSSVRMKDTFQSWMFWGVWPISISAVIGIYAWKEAVDAEEHLAYELTLYGGLAGLVLYAIAVQVYRSNVRGYSKGLWEDSTELRDEARRAMMEGTERLVRAGKGTGRDMRTTGARATERITPEGRRAARGGERTKSGEGKRAMKVSSSSGRRR